MKRFLMAASVIAVVVLSGACGGSDSKTIKTDNGQVSVSKNLPSNFPSDFPVYKGADVQGSFSGNQNDIAGTVVTWTSGDSFDKVKSFYDDAFKNGPWKATTNGTVNDSAYWAGENSDGTKQMYLGVTNAGGNVSIVATVGDKDKTEIAGAAPTSSSSGSATSTSGGGSTSDLPAEAKLPSDFPSDQIPLPSGARVTSATSVSAGGKKNFILELYVKGTPEDAATSLESALTGKGWTQSVSTQSGGEFFVAFTKNTDDGIQLGVTESDVSGYAQVSLTAAVSG